MNKAVVALVAVLLLGCGSGSDGTSPSSVGSAQNRAGTAVEDSDVNDPCHPRFGITVIDLADMVSSLPEDIQNSILADPESFLDLYLGLLAEPAEFFWLIDKSHSLPADYEPDDLVDLVHYPQLSLNRENLRLREIVMPDLLRMVKDAGEDELTLLLSSTYRSYSYQEEVFQYHVNTLGREEAEKESAQPGKSQHQLGTVIDFGSITVEYGETAPGRWLLENAWKYGFSLSYPEGKENLTGYIYEPWHFRYISPAGTEMERRFFSSVQQYMLSFLHENSLTLQSSLK